MTATWGRNEAWWITKLIREIRQHPQKFDLMPFIAGTIAGSILTNAIWWFLT